MSPPEKKFQIYSMNKELYQETFKAESVHWWFLGLHELVEDVIRQYAQEIPNEKNLKILDAGCGTGQMMSRLQEYGFVEGIDASEEALAFCKTRGLTNARFENLNDWIPSDPLYDVIVSLDVLYHQNIQNDIAILGKFYSAMKDKGILVLNLPAFDCLWRDHDVAGWAARRYRRNCLVKQLKEIGFEIKIQSYRLSYLFFPSLLKAWWERINQKRKIGSDLKSAAPPFNQFLFQVNRLENALIKKFNLPVGVSLFIVAQKPGR